MSLPLNARVLRGCNGISIWECSAVIDRFDPDPGDGRVRAARFEHRDDPHRSVTRGIEAEGAGRAAERGGRGQLGDGAVASRQPAAYGPYRAVDRGLEDARPL